MKGLKARSGIWIGKIVYHLGKWRGRAGTSAPGYVASRIDPHVLSFWKNQTGPLILITGTNGKTTASNLVVAAFEACGKQVIHNKGGSNLLQGIISAFMKKSDITGKLKPHDAAILEVDEDTLPKVLSETEPDYIVITNFFRDQLDRPGRGDMDTLISTMQQAIAACKKKPTLIVNADDPFCARFKDTGCPVVWFGLKEDAFLFEKGQVTESKFCPVCENMLTYTHTHYGQLGHYHCVCGFKRPCVQTEVSSIQTTKRGLEVSTTSGEFEISLHGAYNAYNVAAALAVSNVMNLSLEHVQRGFREYQTEKGRMQTFKVEGKPIFLNLAKNPQGVNSTLAEYNRLPGSKSFLFGLNDLGADGKDVSWIWDADYERLDVMKLKQVVCTGRRAYDIAIRLKYAGIPVEHIYIEPHIEKAIDAARKQGDVLAVVTNYTCLEPCYTYLEQLERGVK